jgi:hypothetical protein
MMGAINKVIERKRNNMSILAKFPSYIDGALVIDQNKNNNS